MSGRERKYKILLTNEERNHLKEVLRSLFSVKQISPFSSSEFPIVIVGNSPLSAGLVRKQVPLLHPAA